MKYKIEDKVKIISGVDGAPTSTIGKVGIITRKGDTGDCNGVYFTEEHDGCRLWWYGDNSIELLSFCVGDWVVYEGDDGVKYLGKIVSEKYAEDYYKILDNEDELTYDIKEHRIKGIVKWFD